MNKEDKIGYAVGIIVGIIMLLLTMQTYNQMPGEIVISPIVLTDIPSGAHKVEDVNAPVLYNGIAYGKNVSFLSVKAYDKNFFENKQFDQIDFAISNKRDHNGNDEDTAIVFIRGINYSELPIVYDYKKEFYLFPREASQLWYNFDGDGLTWTASEKAPWALNVKVTKIDQSEAFLASAVQGIVVGFIGGLIGVLITRIFEYARKKFGKKTTGGEEEKNKE